eukprot:gene27252-35990_t
MGNTLDVPKTEKDSHDFISSTSIQIGTSGMQGWRLEMEDAHISTDFPSKPDHLLLAVFDGHAGSGCAEYAAKNLINVIERSSKWKQYVNSGQENPTLIGEILTTSFMELDVLISKHQDQSNGLDTSGCTSVVCVVTPSNIICANAGDSRCVIGNLNKQVKALSYDHKPLNKLERSRIEAAGGFVQWNRVAAYWGPDELIGSWATKGLLQTNRSDNNRFDCFEDNIRKSDPPQLQRPLSGTLTAPFIASGVIHTFMKATAFMGARFDSTETFDVLENTVSYSVPNLVI